MIGKLFRFHKQSRRERPSFRPVLESLERRDVPSAADVSAAFHQLPTDLSNLEASLAARNVNGVNTNLTAVTNDMIILRLGAPGFIVGDRLRIDNTLAVDGIRLIFDGFNTFPFVPGPQFVQIERLGAAAVGQGIVDALVTGFFPQTSGDATLT